MTGEIKYDEGLEEIWRIKREIASEYATLEEYFMDMLAYQEERRKSGVKFVRLPPKRLSGQGEETPLFVAESGTPYDTPPAP